MSLPYDIARCAGTVHELCSICRRREPGSPYWQVQIGPAIDYKSGSCPNRISSNLRKPSELGDI